MKIISCGFYELCVKKFGFFVLYGIWFPTGWFAWDIQYLIFLRQRNQLNSSPKDLTMLWLVLSLWNIFSVPLVSNFSPVVFEFKVCAARGPRPRSPRVWKTRKRIGSISKAAKMIACVMLSLTIWVSLYVSVFWNLF